MEIYTTPEERFADLPDYPFAPHYAELEETPGLKVHYVDEGPADGPVVLLMHGEPSWSYLYRFMIPQLTEGGCRVLAPDLIGFGKSSKLLDRDDYTYEAHVAWMLEWLRQVDPKDMTLFCQDWGGLIGLRLVAAEPERFAGVVVANTGLPIGKGKVPEAFEQWLQFSQNVPQFPVGHIIQQGTVRELTPEEVAAYDAPYPEEKAKAGARAFPALVPVTENHASVKENLAAWEVLSRFEKPFLTAFSDSDPITAGGNRAFEERVPGTREEPHTTTSGGHFLQEDCPLELSNLILSQLKRHGRL